MAKNKKVSGKHSTPRKTIQLPEEWLRLAQRLAAKRPMPVMWLVIELLRKDAEQHGEDIPALPWQPPGSTR